MGAHDEPIEAGSSSGDEVQLPHALPDELDELLRARRIRSVSHCSARTGSNATARKPWPSARFGRTLASFSVVWSTGARWRIPRPKIDPAGLFEAVIPASAIGLAGGEAIAPIRTIACASVLPDGAEFETYDAYAFPPILTEYDLYLSGEGTHYLNYEKLGAHVREVAGVRGVHFARLGAEREARQRGRRFQSLGRARAPDAQPRSQRHLGNFCARAGRRRALQIRDSLARRRSSRPEVRSLRIRRGAAPQDRIGRLQHRPLQVERLRVARRARRARLAAFADVDLRSSRSAPGAAKPTKAIAGSPIANSPTS